MASLGFKLFSGGFAQQATVALNGSIETLVGPSFTIAGNQTTQAEFRQIDFPGRTLVDQPSGDGNVATLILTDRPVRGDTVFDTDGNGRIATVNFALDPTVSAPLPQLAVTSVSADVVTLSEWPTVSLSLARSAGDREFHLHGVRDAAIDLGFSDDRLSLDTGAGPGLLQIATGQGNDAVDIEASALFTGSARVALDAGNDVLHAAGQEDTGAHILAASTGAQPATTSADAAAGVTGSSATFPAITPAPPFALTADGGDGNDQFLLTNVQGRVSGGAGADVFDLDGTNQLVVTPGPGADTVLVRDGATATIAIDRADTGITAATADTLRFSSTSVSGSTVELTGFAAGATARIVPDAPTSTTTFQAVQHAQLQITEPGQPLAHVVELIGVNTDPLEGLAVLFT